MPHPDTDRNQRDIPDSIALGELAIAACAAGCPMTIVYRYFAADVLSALWRFHLRHVGPQKVHHVGREHDVRQLETGAENFQLVLVSRPRLYSAVAWAVLLRVGFPGARPAIFCQFPDCDPDEDPAVTLVLHGRGEESEKVSDYLRAHDCSDGEQRSFQFSGPMVVDPVVERAIENSLQRRRDRQVVRNLIAGECVLRSSSSPRGATESFQGSIEPYRRVYELLQRPVVRATDEPFDPLTRDMVNRANAYLMFQRTSMQKNPRRARLDGSDRNSDGGDRTQRERRITRRELADLGNTKGRTVRRLIECLLGRDDGYRVFRGLGGPNASRKHESWPSRDPKELAKLLIPWSEKQVRDHFHRLYQLNLITAERAGANKPWQYDVPETLVDGDSVFRRLPRPETLSAGDFPPSPHTTAPDSGNCPTAGQLPERVGRPK